MHTLEDAIDDYLHAMVRTHPWDKKRFEQQFEALQDWFDAEFGEPAPLTTLNETNLSLYLAGVHAEHQAEAEQALGDLCRWLAHWGWLEHNPLLALAA